MDVPRFPSAGGSRDITVCVRIIMVPMRVSSIDTDIVIGEFAHFRVVDAEDFCLLVGAHPETRDIVHDPKDDSLQQPPHVKPNLDKMKVMDDIQ